MRRYETARSLRKDSPSSKKKRMEGKRSWKELRENKKVRGRKYSPDEVDLVNQFKSVGIDYFAYPRNGVYKQVPLLLEGKRVDFFSENALTFLKENFEIEYTRDSDLRVVLHFKLLRREEMSVITRVAEELGMKKVRVKKVYDAIIEDLKKSLEDERKAAIPGFLTAKISFRKAKPKRRGVLPFNGKKVWFQAKPASNKLRLTPAKDLRDFVKELKVVDPKKSKDGKKKKKKK